MAGLLIDDYWELLALHRVVMEGKFSEQPRDSVLIGSPVVAKLADRILETLSEMEDSRGTADARKQWQAWRLISPSRLEWPIAVRAAAEAAPWDRWSDAERMNYAQLLTAPLILTDDAMQQFLVEVQHLRSQ